MDTFGIYGHEMQGDTDLTRQKFSCTADESKDTERLRLFVGAAVREQP